MAKTFRELDEAEVAVTPAELIKTIQDFQQVADFLGVGK